MGQLQLVRPVDQQPAGEAKERQPLKIAYAMHNGLVVVDFGATLEWLAFTTEEAEAHCRMVMDMVRQARTIIGGTNGQEESKAARGPR